MCSHSVALARLPAGDAKRSLLTLIKLQNASLFGAEAAAAEEEDAAAAAAAAAAGPAPQAHPPAHAGTPAEFCVHNCSISTVDIFASGVVRVVRVNDVSHLLFAAAAATAPATANNLSREHFVPRYDLVTGGCVAY